jgi:3'(2'), 5'-bisphosphate nucleotidase
VSLQLPDLEAVVHIVRDAAAVVMSVYDGPIDVRTKGDASPVTEADERAEALIVPALRALAPHIPVVAEEMAARGEADAVGRTFWLVDPLDGTKGGQHLHGAWASPWAAWRCCRSGATAACPRVPAAG